MVSPPWRQLGHDRQAEALYFIPTAVSRGGETTPGPWARIVPTPGEGEIVSVHRVGQMMWAFQAAKLLSLPSCPPT